MKRSLLTEHEKTLHECVFSLVDIAYQIWMYANGGVKLTTESFQLRRVSRIANACLSLLITNLEGCHVWPVCIRSFPNATRFYLYGDVISESAVHTLTRLDTITIGTAHFTNQLRSHSLFTPLTNLTSLRITEAAHFVMNKPSLQALQTRLTKLSLTHSHQSCGFDFASMSGLRSLTLRTSIDIPGPDHRPLPASLTSLSLWNQHHTDNAVMSLTGLTRLKMRFVTGITGAGISCLTSLTHLTVGMNTCVTDAAIVCLTGLTTLDLKLNNCITDSGISGLTRLTSLDLSMNECITDAAIVCLTGLTTLDLKMARGITDSGLSGLTRLTSLDLSMNECITDRALDALTDSLTDLTLYKTPRVTVPCLLRLNRLKRLHLVDTDLISVLESRDTRFRIVYGV